MNPTNVERLKKILEDKEFELVEQAKKADLHARLQMINGLLLQRDWELQVERQRTERAIREKDGEEKAL